MLEYKKIEERRSGILECRNCVGFGYSIIPKH